MRSSLLMLSPAAIAVAIAIAVIIAAVVYRMKKGSTSCFVWTSFKPSAKELPSGAILGAGSNTSMIPAGARNTDGTWYLGATQSSPTDPNWGRFLAAGGALEFKPDQLWVLVLNPNASCKNATLKKFDGTGKALKFNGLGVCWNFGTAAMGSFSATGPDGKCGQWSGLGSFDPVADQME